MSNDAQRPFTDVAALMQERRKYETWLAALEARRTTTSVHVFDRVRQDYETRLERVMGELLSHRDALEQRVRELDDRIHGIESSEQQRRDQRAEMELRAHVGELRDNDFERAVREVDEAISRAEAEKGELRDELTKASELLVAVTMPRAMVAIEEPAAPAAPPPAPAPAAPAPSPEPVFVAPDPAPPPQPMRRPSFPMRAPAAEVVAASERPPVQQVAPAGEPPAEVRPPAAPEPPRPARVSGFDELAFLQSIVGPGEGGGQRVAQQAPPAAPPQQAPAAAAPPPAPVAPPAPPAPAAPAPVADVPPRPAQRQPVAPIADFQMIRDDDTGAGSIRASQAAGIVNDENIGASLVSRMPDNGRAPSETPLAANVTGNHPIVLRQAGDAATPKTLRCAECGSMNYPTEWYCERCGAELAAL